MLIRNKYIIWNYLSELNLEISETNTITEYNYADQICLKSILFNSLSNLF